jgi:hypothetical protein
MDWQWQLSGRLDLRPNAPVYDVDLFTTSASTVTELHRRHRTVICYVSVGAWENFRPDAKAYPASVLGRGNGWPGERWLDVRRLDVLLPLVARRFDQCRAKGFDAVEPDNVDGYGNETGFPLSAADQLAFNRALARLAHQRGLGVGLKNDVEQIPALVDTFDFAVNEQCVEYDECVSLVPFTSRGKPVFHAEYSGTPSAFCSQTRRYGLSTILKREDLDAYRVSCANS